MMILTKYVYSLQFYLRKWTNELETPIVSIDYTLAPDGPFPRALEECVLAYAWMLQNLNQLGVHVCGMCSHVHVFLYVSNVVQ